MSKAKGDSIPSHHGGVGFVACSCAIRSHGHASIGLLHRYVFSSLTPPVGGEKVTFLRIDHTFQKPKKIEVVFFFPQEFFGRG